MKEKPDYAGNDVESYETQRLLDHDTLAQNYEELPHELTSIVPTYTSTATVQICKFSLNKFDYCNWLYLILAPTPGDYPIPLDLESGTDKKIYDVEALSNKVTHSSKYGVFISNCNKASEEKVSCMFHIWSEIYVHVLPTLYFNRILFKYNLSLSGLAQLSYCNLFLVDVSGIPVQNNFFSKILMVLTQGQLKSIWILALVLNWSFHNVIFIHYHDKTSKAFTQTFH